MRLLHFADLHLDMPFCWAPVELARARRGALRDTLARICELAAELQLEALTCGGDLYEQERFTPDTAEFLRSMFEQIAPLRVFLAPGWLGPASLYRQVRWSPNVHVFTDAKLSAVELVGWTWRHGGMQACRRKSIRQSAKPPKQPTDVTMRSAGASGLESTRRRSAAWRSAAWRAGGRVRAASYGDDLGQWVKRHRELENELGLAAAGLSSALAARGHLAASASPEDLTVSVHSYRAACGQRAEQAAEASKREPLHARLEALQQKEQRADQDRQRRADAARLIADAARGCGLVTDSPDATAQELGKWSIKRGAQMEQAAAAQKEWANLQALLNGRSLEQLQKEAASSAEVHGIGYVRV